MYPSAALVLSVVQTARTPVSTGLMLLFSSKKLAELSFLQGLIR